MGDEWDQEAELEREREMELERHLMAQQPPETQEPDNEPDLPWETGGGGARAGTSGAQRSRPNRKRPAHNYNENSSDEGSQAGSSRAGQPFRRHIDTVNDRDDDAYNPPAQGVDALSSHSRRLHQGLDKIPGWNAMIMGNGIDPEPPTFETGLPGHWLQWKGEGPFSGSKCRPARVLDLGFVAAWQQAPDAERISDMSAQTELGARSRTVATCALMGMLSVGMAKGYLASENHSELVQARKGAQQTPGADPPDEGKLKKQQLKRLQP